MMDIEMFVYLLSVFSAISGLTTEAIKKLILDKKNLPYNILALITGILVSSIGTSIYYYLSDIPFTAKNIIFIVLMGFASALVSMLGFDKIKETIKYINSIKK